MNADSTQEHETVRLSLGAYLLGGLGPAQRGDVEQHVASCPSCRDELAGLAVVPSLLRRIEPPPRLTPAGSPAASDLDGAGEGERALDSVLPRLLTEVRTERAKRRKHDQKLRLVTAVAGVTAAAALAAAVTPAVVDLPGGGRAPTEIAMAPGGGIPSSGRAGLEGRVWGTSVTLELERLPAGASFVAWAVADDGHRERAAAWGSTPNGTARLSGATAIPRTQLARVEVSTTAGKTLLTAPA